jgi:hypothetical protein
MRQAKNSFATRYWSGLVSSDTSRRQQQRREKDGYSFSRRFVATLLGVSLPPRSVSSNDDVSRSSNISRLSRPSESQAFHKRRSWIVAAATMSMIATLGIVVTLVESRGEGMQRASEVSFETVPFRFDPVLHVMKCFDYTGTGSRPREGAVALLSRREGAVDVYYSGSVQFKDNDTWSARSVKLGPPDGDGKYRLIAVAITKQELGRIATTYPIEPVSGHWRDLESVDVINDISMTADMC